ncbi:MAG: hypothetical protein SGI99_00610 [Pseudomonadota bacterium]|nr:hypothetical protein [Pseudomonadota bacterium]
MPALRCRLSGGWTGAGSACTTQTLGAGKTQLDGEFETGILKVYVQQGSSATISIHNLGFYRGAALVNNTGSVDVEINTATTAKVWFARNSILQSFSDNGATAGLRAVARRGRLRVTGNLIVGNASEGICGVAGVLFSAFNGALAYFNNNTVSSNSGNGTQGGSSGVYFYAMTPLWVSNNVITGNASTTASSLQYQTDTNGTGQLRGICSRTPALAMVQSPTEASAKTGIRDCLWPDRAPRPGQGDQGQTD